jgi:undecaprenyl pyrophosphate phosphatase UppP
MSRKTRHPKDAETKKRTERTVKRILKVLIGFLIAVLLALMLEAGEAWWPVWVVAHRRQVEWMIVLAVILLILAAPLIVEASSSPRPLSGPGKNPEGPRLP